ncbi:MAG: hypothetical protein ABI689_15370 [Thermoanaerobaculia bacterium]
MVLSGVLAAGLAANAWASVVPADCSSGAVPAATLLIPYFEVDLISADHQSTLFAVTNTGADATLAHVVVWTDWGVPTLTFDLYLAANDVQSINLRDVFSGILPQTGGGSFTGCTNPLTLPALDAIALAELRKQHTGQPDDLGLCAGSGRAGAQVATGFVTIDVAQQCSETITYPGHAGYFSAGGTGVAGNANLLIGDFFYVDTAENYAQGNEAVAIVADAGRFGAQPATFYGAWIGHSGDDARAPLGTRYRSRYLNGGAFSGGTDLIVWAEPDVPTPQAVTCGSRPTFVNPCQFLRTTAFDEAAQGDTPEFHFVVSELASRFAVGSTAVPVTAPFGFVDLENAIQLGCAFEPIGETPKQLWVMPVSSASGRFSVGLNAHRTGDALCPAPVL